MEEQEYTHTHTHMLESIELNDIEKWYFSVADSLQPRGLVQCMLTLKLLGSKRALFENNTESKSQVCVHLCADRNKVPQYI